MVDSTQFVAEKETTAPPPSLSVVLSREEVLVILRLIGVSTIPGLGEEPIPNLSDEQQALSLIVAERALRARGLAAINMEDRLLVQKAILQMLGTCSFASQSVYVTQMVAPSGGAAQLIAHNRDNAWVLHTRPELVLHEFELVNSWSSTVKQITTFCQWPQEASSSDFSLTVASHALGTVRELAANDRIDEANSLLVAAGNESSTAKKLTHLLSKSHFVTVMQWVTAESDDAIAIKSVTVLHRNNELFVAIESARAKESDGDDDDETIVIQPFSIDRLEYMLTDMILGNMN